MESSHDLKPAIEERLRPVARRLAALGISAGEVRLAGLVLSGVGGVLILVAPGAPWPLVLLPVF
ncbi:MAG: CDP-alcohol phosphatidyltransferase family protein, partial [Rhodospirillaceae bacterium]|nr:CDP-alcohol phosphatidyltransferase family protein [Rhodospirillaceae bacterium]